MFFQIIILNLKMSKNEESENGNFIYEKMIQNIKYYTYSPINIYTPVLIKNLDKNSKITPEIFVKIKNVFSLIRNAYIEEIDGELEKYEEKYSLKSKMQLKSEVLMTEKVLQDLNLSVDTLKKIEQLNEADNQDTALLKEHLTSFLTQENQKLKENNEKLKKELSELKEKNKIDFFNNNNK